jgi:hypothetical protein
MNRAWRNDRIPDWRATAASARRHRLQHRIGPADHLVVVRQGEQGNFPSPMTFHAVRLQHARHVFAVRHFRIRNTLFYAPDETAGDFSEWHTSRRAAEEFIEGDAQVFPLCLSTGNAGSITVVDPSAISNLRIDADHKHLGHPFRMQPVGNDVVVVLGDRKRGCDRRR